MTATSLPNPYPSPGEVIDGKYQIERVLGEGGMGCVARAYHLLLRAPVALKFMNPQFMTFPGAVERFINEGIASKKIRSDHVVPVDDVGKLASGAPYLVMPCLEGMDLAELLAREGSPGLPTPRAIHFTLQILRGLQAAHAAGIIHRDMKPSNCFVVRNDGEDDFVRILDFGISKVVEPGSASLTQTNSALGTPLYMSPEQARSPRDVDGRSDIYSVGVILYELLSGHTPFFSESGEFTEILFKLFTADPPPVQSTRPDLSDDLAAVVHKALARDPAHRYTTAQDLAEALEPFADERSKRIAARIRNFKPEQSNTVPPAGDVPLPPSMVAFSALDARPATDVMARRPTTDVMKSPPVTQVMDQAPPRVASTPSFGRLSARPPDVAAQATQEESSARTQFGDIRPRSAAVTGASTDLGASADAQPAPTPPRRSPLLYALPVAALLAIVGVGLAAKSTGGAKPDASGSAVAAPTPPPSAATNNVTLPPPSATTLSTGPATTSTPSATPSASASAKPRIDTPAPPSSTKVIPKPSSTDVLDTPIHN